MVSIRKMRPLGLAGIFTGTGAPGAADPAGSVALDDDVFLGGKLLV